MSLTEKNKRYLRTLGHKLKPVIIIGNAGLTEAVLKETGLALNHHELIKIRVNAADRAARDQMIDEICSGTHATLIQRIGHVALFYLRNKDKPSIKII